MAEGPPKSAVELALEKLKKQDAQAGVERQTLSDAQREAITAARRDYEARVAECRILHESQMAGLLDPESRHARDEEYRRDLARLASTRDKKIDAIVTGDA